MAWFCATGRYWRTRPQSGRSTPDGKQSMAVWRRELGLREIVIDPVRCPLAYEEFRLKEFERDHDGTWLDEIPDGTTTASTRCATR